MNSDGLHEPARMYCLFHFPTCGLGHLLADFRIVEAAVELFCTDSDGAAKIADKYI